MATKSTLKSNVREEILTKNEETKNEENSSYSQEWLQSELSKSQQLLQRTEKKLKEFKKKNAKENKLQQYDNEEYDSNEDEDSNGSSSSSSSSSDTAASESSSSSLHGGYRSIQEKQVRMIQRLQLLTCVANEIELVNDIRNWQESIQIEKENPATEEKQEIKQLFQNLLSLGTILLRHEYLLKTAVVPSNDGSVSSMWMSLYHEEYLPVYAYLRTKLLLCIRKELYDSGYPSIIGCKKILNHKQQQGEGEEKDNNNNNLSLLGQYIELLTHLQCMNDALTTVIVQQQQYNDDGNNRVVTDIYNKNDIIIELFRPIVQRIQYHFVKYNEKNLTTSRIDRLPEWLFNYLRDNIFKKNGPWDVITKSINRIIVSSNTVANTKNNSNSVSFTQQEQQNDLLATLMNDKQKILLLSFPIQFINELIQLIQWVLVKERKFFRHEQIIGQNSNPLLLCNAIQEYFLFDKYIKELISPWRVLSSSSNNNDSNNNNNEQQQQQQQFQLNSLVQDLFCNDVQLFEWWLEREKETIFHKLFNDEDIGSSTNSNSPLPGIGGIGVSRRTELFCSIIRSVQHKASLLLLSNNNNNNKINPGLVYLRNIAVPLCMEFLDAIHETAATLKTHLATKQTKKQKQQQQQNLNINDILIKWIQLINGTNWAAQILLASSSPSSSANAIDTTGAESNNIIVVPNQDLERFGKSLKHLVQVMIEELSKTFVEIVLLEHTKLAGYLMRSSHLLATSQNGHENNEYMVGEEESLITSDLSDDLRETYDVLLELLKLCKDKNNSNNNINNKSVNDEDKNETDKLYNDNQQLFDSSISLSLQHAHYAPPIILEQVYTSLADKFLEIALNVHGMTPYIYPLGSAIFARDVRRIFLSQKTKQSSSQQQQQQLPVIVLRLLDIVQFMSMEGPSLDGLRSALLGLASDVNATNNNDYYGNDDPYENSESNDGLHNLLADSTIYEEALNMIQAKGFSYIYLEDVVSILTRRKD